MTARRISLEWFDQVSFRGPGTLRIVQGETETLHIEAPDDVLSRVSVACGDGELRLGYRSASIVSLRAHHVSVACTLEVRELKSLNCQGVNARIELIDLDTDQFALCLTGQGSIVVQRLTADTVDTQINGAGSVRIEGDVEQQHLSINGAGKYAAGKLVSDFAAIRINGAGMADVSVSAALDVLIRGAGQVSYAGYPELRREIAGAGRVWQRRPERRRSATGEDHG